KYNIRHVVAMVSRDVERLKCRASAYALTVSKKDEKNRSWILTLTWGVKITTGALSLCHTILVAYLFAHEPETALFGCCSWRVYI
ncbi:hypothetical protein BDZ89DRAFT_1075988, partial [Hymenopellis radicata]